MLNLPSIMEVLEYLSNKGTCIIHKKNAYNKIETKTGFVIKKAFF